jgi:hypothetical protein
LRSLAIRFAHYVGWLHWADKDLVTEYVAAAATRLASQSIDELLPPAWLGRGDAVPASAHRPLVDVVRSLITRRVDVAVAVVSAVQRRDPLALKTLRERWAFFPPYLNGMPCGGDLPCGGRGGLTVLDRASRETFGALCAQRLLLELTLDAWVAEPASTSTDGRYENGVDFVTSRAERHLRWLHSIVPEVFKGMSALSKDRDAAKAAVARLWQQPDDAPSECCECFWSWVGREYLVALPSGGWSRVLPRRWRSATFLRMTADKGEIYVRGEQDPLRVPNGALLEVFSRLTVEGRRLVADIARFELWLRCQGRVTWMGAGVGEQVVSGSRDHSRSDRIRETGSDFRRDSGREFHDAMCRRALQTNRFATVGILYLLSIAPPGHAADAGGL